MTGLVRAFREGILGLWRTGMVGAVSLVTTAASLLVLAVFGQVVAGVYGLAESLRARAEVEIYLKDGQGRRRALALARELEALEGVAEVHYIDKEEAAVAFRDMFGDGMLDALSQNPLPTSIRVRLVGGSNMAGHARAVAEAVSGRREVEGVDLGEMWLASLDRFVKVCVWTGIVLGGVLCLACAFTVSNTAKLMVLSQRDAIVVMRLVGATGGFIRVTFLLGGAVQGLAGGVLASIGVWFGAAWWTPWIPELTPISPFYPIAGVLGLGTLLGVVGSWASLNRVLNAVVWR